MLFLILTLIILGTVIRPVRPLADVGRWGRWFQIASYRHGTVAHLTPIRETYHTEDETGDCICKPKAGPYPLRSGQTGTLFVHRIMANDKPRAS